MYLYASNTWEVNLRLSDNGYCYKLGGLYFSCLGEKTDAFYIPFDRTFPLIDCASFYLHKYY